MLHRIISNNRCLSNQIQGLNYTNEWSHHSDHSDNPSLPRRLIQVVIRHKNIQNIFNKLNRKFFHQLRSLLHIQHLPLVPPLHYNQSERQQTFQRPNNILPFVKFQTTRIVHRHIILANHLQLPKHHPMVKHVKEQSEQMLQNHQYLFDSRRMVTQNLSKTT